MKLESLLKKRAALEKQIVEAQRIEKRKTEVTSLLEKCPSLLSLTDEILLGEFQEITRKHGIRES